VNARYGEKESEMTGSPQPLLQSIGLEGFLSFGVPAHDIPLRALNVVIGPNGSGKSNLVEAIAVLRAVPRDLPLPIREGGGVKDWLWKCDASGAGAGDGTGRGMGSAPGSGFGDGTGHDVQAARLELVFAEGHLGGGAPAIRYGLAFGAEGDRFVVLDERLENAEARPGETDP
jgi:predicted ATPase